MTIPLNNTVSHSHTAQQLECLPEIELVKSWAYEARLTEKGMSINKKSLMGSRHMLLNLKMWNLNMKKCKNKFSTLWTLSKTVTVLRKISTEVLKCWPYTEKHIGKHHEYILVREKKMAQMIASQKVKQDFLNWHKHAHAHPLIQSSHSNYLG